MRNKIKAKLNIYIAITVVLMMGMISPVLADGTEAQAEQGQQNNTVVNEFCQTIVTMYGSETRCDTEIVDTGFVPAEIIMLSAGAFTLGVSTLFIRNYTEQLAASQLA